MSDVGQSRKGALKLKVQNSTAPRLKRSVRCSVTTAEGRACQKSV